MQFKNLAIVALALSLMPCAVQAAPKTGIKIAKVTIPAEVPQGSAKFSMTVKLSGSPVFPVTLTYYPLACPKGCTIDNLTFLPMKAIFAVKSSKLVIKNIKACWLIDYPSAVFFDYAVIVRDKLGRVTPAVKQGFSCVP